MRPPILTDDCLAELDAQADLDAVDRHPTDDGFIRDLYRKMCSPARREPAPRTWDEWVRLP